MCYQCHGPKRRRPPSSSLPTPDVVTTLAGNVYAYMPPSVARDFSIVLMVLHQVIVFGLVRARAAPSAAADWLN